MKLNLASKDITTKTPPKDHAYYVSDTVERRLLLKVHPSGVRSYHWSQGYVHGVRKRPQLERFEDTQASTMRKKVQEYNHQMSEGNNPFSADLQKLTLTMFLEDIFMPQKQLPHTASDGTRLGISMTEYKNRLSMINAHIKSSIGKTLLKDMTYPAVDTFLTSVARKSPTQAKNIRIFLTDAWREALRQHSSLRLPNFFEMWDIKTLSKRIKQNKTDNRPLRVDLGEGVAMYNAIETAIDTSPLIARCIKLIYLTSVRKMSMAELRFEDIKYDETEKKYYAQKIWKDEEATLFFGEESMKVIEEVKQKHKDLNLVKFQHLFPQFKNERYIDTPITADQMRVIYEGSGHGKIKGILGEAGKEAPTLLGTKDIPKFTLHDFRDTVASHTKGEDSQHSLGHKHIATTEEHYKKQLKANMSKVASVREATMTNILKDQEPG